jgi:hypothetical protein
MTNITIIKTAIEIELNEQKIMLNSGDYEYYRDELDPEGERKEETTAELIEGADFENVDFNIGFEQGYLRGLEVALSHFKN